MIDALFAALLGLVAGLAASAVMEAFQTLASKAFDPTDGSKDQPATVMLAERVHKAATGRALPRAQRAVAGRGVHYLTGAGLGVLYGVTARAWPPVTLGFGTAFGVASELMLDSAVVPFLGLGAPPWKTPLKLHAYSLSAHLVFGVALEASRRLGAALLG